MTDSAVRVRTEETTKRRVAEARWHRESSTFTCTISPADHPSAEPSLRERVDTALGIEAPVRRVILGDIDVLLDDADRPASIELYTNPARWKRAPAEDIGPLKAADVKLEATWDENGIASQSAPVTIEYDAARTTVTLRLGAPALRWVTAAEGMLIGIGERDRVAGLRFESVKMDP